MLNGISVQMNGIIYAYGENGGNITFTSEMVALTYFHSQRTVLLIV